MRIDVSKIKDNVDILRVFEREGFHTKRDNATTYSTSCFTGHDSKSGNSFHIRTDTQTYKCWNCGVSGDAIKFIEEYKNMSFYDACKYLADAFNIDLGIDIDVKFVKLPYNEINDIFVKTLKSQKWKRERAVVLNYLRKHRIDIDAIDEYHIGLITEKTANYLMKEYEEDSLYEMRLVKDSRFIHTGLRITVPITNYGKIVGWSMRTIDAGTPKFLTLTKRSIDKNDLFFALDTIHQRKRVVVTEGVFDAIRLNKIGIDAVATLGLSANFTKLNNFDIVVMFYDGDEAGINAMRKVFFDNFPAINIKLGNVGSYDPCDADDTLCKYTVETANGGVEYLSDKLLGHGISNHDRALRATKLLQDIDKLPDEIKDALKATVLSAVGKYSYFKEWLKIDKLIREEIKNG